MADELQILINCMEKAGGTRMPDEIKTSILARAKALIDEQGLKPIAASRAALNEYLGAVQQDIAQVEASMKAPAAPPSVSEVKAEQTDNLDTFLKAVEREREEESVKLRAVASPQAVQAAAQTKAVAGQVKNFISSLPKDSDFRRALLEWVGRAQENTFEVLALNKDITKNARSPVGREGITNFIQAGGDRVLLGQRAQASKNRDLKKGYAAAANLTPEEQAAVQIVNKTYADAVTKAKYWGINVNEIPNYVTQIWDLGKGTRGMGTRNLSEYFRFVKPRTFDSFFDGEKEGYIPKTKDISALVSIYMNDLNHAINSRIFVQQMSKGKASDGNPLLAVGGRVQVSPEEQMAAGKGAYLVFPEAMPAGKLKDVGYKYLDAPALRKWVWKGVDEKGNPIFLHSDLLVHPEIHKHLSRVLGSSGIREWWNAETDNPFVNLAKNTLRLLLDELQPAIKATMFSLSPFHQVQEGTHAIGHKVNPFTDIPEINLAGPKADPKQVDAVRHGLMLRADRISQEQFIEGVGSNEKNLITKGLRKFGKEMARLGKPGAWIGKPGNWLAGLQDWYTDYLFQNYIPGLKYKTYEHILARNTKRFEKDIASGKVSLAQVKMLSADQANAAYGHLNYAAIGRSPTMQHIWQIVGLAPDFFEARARFALQAAKTGAKAFGGDPRPGLEQFHALLLLAGIQFVAAQIVNMLINGKAEPEDMLEHPFDIIAGNKRYGLRSVPGDLLHLGTDLYDMATGRAQGSSFIQGRLSPIVGKGVGQVLFGVNYRKEPVTLSEAGQDMLFGVVPLPFQGLTRGLTSTGRSNPISWLEQMMGAGGIVIHRVSPLSDIYPMAREWMKENDPKKVDNVVFPVSKYQQLRFALEDSDDNQALTEARALQNSGMTAKQIVDGFRESMKMPFTGSLANDRQFYLSLDAHDRAKFDAALDRRAVIINRFDKLIPSGKEPITRQTLLNRIFKE